MPYEIAKYIMRQLFPKGVLPMPVAVIAAVVIGVLWWITKKDDSFMIKKVSSFLKDKPEWQVWLSAYLYLLVLAVYWGLIQICPEIKLGFLLNTVVFVLICIPFLVAMCFMVVAHKIINGENTEYKENKFDS